MGKWVSVNMNELADVYNSSGIGNYTDFDEFCVEAYWNTSPGTRKYSISNYENNIEDEEME